MAEKKTGMLQDSGACKLKEGIKITATTNGEYIYRWVDN